MPFLDLQAIEALDQPLLLLLHGFPFAMLNPATVDRMSRVDLALRRPERRATSSA